MSDPRFLITGCGCSGTYWVARVLTALDVPCTHEKVFRPGGPKPWKQRGESSWCAIPFIDKPIMRDVIAIRIVRDPFAAVNSAIADGFLVANRRGVRDPFANFVFKYAPDIAAIDDSILASTSPAAARAIHWVTQWDRPAAHLPTVRVEDGTAAIVEILNQLGITRGRVQIAQTIERIGQHVNTHHRGHTRRYTRDELLSLPDGHLLVERADKLGY